MKDLAVIRSPERLLSLKPTPYVIPAEFDPKPGEITIRIIRHPIDSFYSLYVERHSGNPPSRRIPKRLLLEFISRWKKFQRYWNEQENVLTIRYEDMLAEPEVMLKRIIQRVGYTFTEEDISRAIQKYPPEGFPLKHLKNYDPEDIELIRKELEPLISMYGYTLST